MVEGLRVWAFSAVCRIKASYRIFINTGHHFLDASCELLSLFAVVRDP